MPGGKSFKVLDLFCGTGIIREPVLKRLEKIGGQLEYVGIDKKRQAKPLDKPEIKEEFHETTLDLKNPNKLEEQLKKILGGKKFDEIHFHSPAPIEAWSQAGRGLEALKILAKFLKEGGRLYHVFHESSPLADFPTVTPLSPLDAHKAFSLEQAKWNLIAEQAGLKLKNYKIRSKVGLWVPSSGGEKFAWKASEKYDSLIAAYSRWSEYADHFVIFYKPTREERAKKDLELAAERLLRRL